MEQRYDQLCDADRVLAAWRYFNFNDGSTFAHPVQQTNAAGQTTSFQYDYGTGKLAATTDPNGVTTTYSYADTLDRLTQVVAAAGTSAETHTSYSYTNRTQVSQYRDQNSAGDGALRSDTIDIRCSGALEREPPLRKCVHQYCLYCRAVRL